MLALVMANMCLYYEVTNLSFCCSVDFCSCEVACVYTTRWLTCLSIVLLTFVVVK